MEAIACGVHVGRHAVRAGARRLLRAGERAELQQVALELTRPAARVEGTRTAAAAVLRAAAAGAGRSAGLHLVVLSGPAAGACHALHAEQTIGRGRAATIVLPDGTASRVHARVRVGPDGPRVEDLGSKNGVRVNGARTDQGPTPIRVGDELVVGETALALADGAPVDEVEPPAAPLRGGGRGLRHLLAAALLALSAAALVVAAGY